MSKASIDAIDRKILQHLIRNARMPFLEIARECGISGAAIHQRVKKLDEMGVILGSRLEVDPKKARIRRMCAHRHPRLRPLAVRKYGGDAETNPRSGGVPLHHG